MINKKNMETKQFTKVIEEFKAQTGYELEVKDGKPYYPKNIYIEPGTHVTSLPEGLVVGGSLDMKGVEITSLPEGLTVGGYLNLSNTSITILPKGLVVGGTLDLSYTKISSLPKDIVVGGSLILYDTEVTSLSDGLTVGVNLLIGSMKITSLPERLTVGWNLFIRDTGITSLPKGLTVGGNIYASTETIINTGDVNTDSSGILEWNNYEYVKAGGIFSKVISHRGDFYRVSRIGKSEEMCLFHDPREGWSHVYALPNKLINKEDLNASEKTLEAAHQAYDAGWWMMRATKQEQLIDMFCCGVEWEKQKAMIGYKLCCPYRVNGECKYGGGSDPCNMKSRACAKFMEQLK